MHISMKHSHLKWDKLGAKKVSRVRCGSVPVRCGPLR